MTEPSKTPRTDALAAKLSDADSLGAGAALALLHHANMLERELATAMSGISDSQRRADDAQAAESIAQLAVERVREYAEAVTRFAAAHRKLLEEIYERTKPDGDMIDSAVCGLAETFYAIGLTSGEWDRYLAIIATPAKAEYVYPPVATAPDVKNEIGRTELITDTDWAGAPRTLALAKENNVGGILNLCRDLERAQVCHQVGRDTVVEQLAACTRSFLNRLDKQAPGVLPASFYNDIAAIESLLAKLHAIFRDKEADRG